MINLLQKNKTPLRILLAVFILIAGVAHFWVDEPFIRIVPDFLPFPAALVYISGVIEIGLAIGLLVPEARVRSLAAWGLIALFIAVYPANLNMAFNHIKIAGIPNNWLFHGIRLPFQFVLIGWAYWYTNDEI